MFQRFVSLGLDQFELLETCETTISEQIKEEPADEQLLITTIKNLNREQKAK